MGFSKHARFLYFRMPRVGGKESTSSPYPAKVLPKVIWRLSTTLRLPVFLPLQVIKKTASRMTRINVCYHPCQISNCTNARSPRCPAVSPACRCPSPVEEVPPFCWNTTRRRGLGEWRRKIYTPTAGGPQNLWLAKGDTGFKIWPEFGIYVKFLGCNLGFAYQVNKLDFLEHFSPKWWLWCWYILHYSKKQSNMKKLRELLRSLIWPACPWAPILWMNFKPGKRPTSLRLHGN